MCVVLINNYLDIFVIVQFVLGAMTFIIFVFRLIYLYLYTFEYWYIYILQLRVKLIKLTLNTTKMLRLVIIYEVSCVNLEADVRHNP